MNNNNSVENLLKSWNEIKEKSEAKVPIYLDKFGESNKLNINQLKNFLVFHSETYKLPKSSDEDIDCVMKMFGEGRNYLNTEELNELIQTLLIMRYSFQKTKMQKQQPSIKITFNNND